jgi:hypothetical protein
LLGVREGEVLDRVAEVLTEAERFGGRTEGVEIPLRNGAAGLKPVAQVMAGDEAREEEIVNVSGIGRAVARYGSPA